jgi:predicted nuclease of predicted toxin-antitoxin system
MRFLADHNLEGPVFVRLRREGYDVMAVAELDRRLPDPEVLESSEREERILLTNDKDFAELAFLQRKATVGIVLLRLPEATSQQKAIRLLEVVRSEGERLYGAFTVIGPHAARRRVLPSISSGRGQGC